jgi:hypothetical protein
MNLRNSYCSKILFIIYFFFFSLSMAIHATDHKKPVMEPYALQGKRIVFTNWFYVRPGHFDWLNEKGESVYARSDVDLGENEAQFISTDAPYGIKLISEPAKSEMPIIKTDKAWDKFGIRLATLILDGDQYRLWGSCNADNVHAYNCYFESMDGQNWVKPNLGLVMYNGNKENNLIDRDVGLSVFIDPVAPPAQKYKTMWHTRLDSTAFLSYKKTRDWSYYAVELDRPLIHALKAAYSPDGLTWTILKDPLAFEHMDTQTVGYYDTDLQEYVLYSREHMVGRRAAGQPYPAQTFHQRVSRRAIGRTESATFDRFPLSKIIIETESDMHPSDDFYTNCRTTIPGAPDHHLMFPALYNVSDDGSDILFYASYNGINWHRVPGGPVYRTQPVGNPDGGWIIAHPNLVERPNGDWILPYDGYNVPHKYARGAYRFEPGLLVWPKGRLVGIEATEVGAFATAAIVPPGKHLHINTLTQRTGFVKIEVVNMDGQIVEGRAFNDFIPIFGDHHFTQAAWKSGNDLGVPEGEPVYLRFQLKMAKIYGLEFR